MTNTLQSLWAQVEAVISQEPGLLAAHIADRIQGTTRKRVIVAINNLLAKGRIHSQPWGVRHSVYYPGPRPATTRASSIERRKTAGTWIPPRWTNEIARPGGEAHKLCGSLQADGTVAPYHRPQHGCVGSLRESANQGRD